MELRFEGTWEEDLKEDLEEDTEEDPKEDFRDDLEEEAGKDHMEVFETGSNVYSPRDGGVKGISTEHDPEGCLVYHPKTYRDMDDDNDDALT
uniref:Uncharacterized protein n=1 Tax=Solanum tuberosum TaxID=4113 RepID=M1DSJ5_SOLTU